MIRFREHRGTLAASLETAVTLKDRADLVRYLGRLYDPLPVTDESVVIAYYGFDDRGGLHNLYRNPAGRGGGRVY